MNTESEPNEQSSFEEPGDRSVERVFMFVRTTILLAICAGLGFLGWTVKVVDNGTNKMFEGAVTEELAMPAEGPDDVDTHSSKSKVRKKKEESELIIKK